MSNLKAIKNHVIFQFDDNSKVVVGNGPAHTEFVETTDWGFTHTDRDETMNQPRWGVCIAVGDKGQSVNVGDHILVDALRWTNSFTYEGDKYWRTDTNSVLAIDD